MLVIGAVPAFVGLVGAGLFVVLVRLARRVRRLCPEAPRPQLHMVWPLPMRPRTRRRQAGRTARRVAA